MLSLKQRSRRDAQPPRQLEQRFHADVALAAFDPADILGWRPARSAGSSWVRWRSSRCAHRVGNLLPASVHDMFPIYEAWKEEN